MQTHALIVKIKALHNNHVSRQRTFDWHKSVRMWRCE